MPMRRRNASGSCSTPTARTRRERSAPFASLLWLGPSGTLLGCADRSDGRGFYGPAEPGGGSYPSAALSPPHLALQDEFHLIAGPLRSTAGLYEAAIEALCVRQIDGRRGRPKIVASTATVRQAQDHIQALFARV